MKAIGLLSGGIDSTLAAKLIIDQGIQVEALKFTSPFCNCDNGGKCHSAEAAEELGLPLITIIKGDEYLDVVRSPKYGYGSHMNPCIDCRIFMLSKAREYADKSGAAFVFTGEVLGQRPMSQHRAALTIIERESGLKGKLLRPLSAKYLPETDVEKAGIVDRSKLIGITGRSRKPQFELLRKFKIRTFACPAGGCLLTDPGFAARLSDFLSWSSTLSMTDVILLKHGRHFRNGTSRIAVGRNEAENNILETLCADQGFILKPRIVMGPSSVLFGGSLGRDEIEYAAHLTASYCDTHEHNVEIEYAGKGMRGVFNAEIHDKSFYRDTLI